MRLFIKSFSLVLIFLLALLPSAQAVTVSPVLRLSALGGEFFTTSAESTGGNYDATVAPVIGLTDPLFVGSRLTTRAGTMVLSRSLVTYTSNTQFELDYPCNYNVFNVVGGLTGDY